MFLNKCLILKKIIILKSLSLFQSLKRKYFATLFVTFFISLFCFSNLFAEKSYYTEIIINNKQSFSSEIGDTNTEEFTGNVDIIKIDPKSSKSSLTDYIEENTNLDFRQSGALGSISTVSIRGSSPSQLNVFIDGVLLNSASSGFFDISNIDISEIEKIEIYKGTIPINLGTGSMGGAINLITKRLDKPHKSLKYNFASNNFMGINAYYRDNKFLFNFTYFISKNNFKFLNDNGTEYNKSDDEFQLRHNNDILENNILVKYKILDINSFKVNSSINYFRKLQNLPTWNNLENPETYLGTERYLFTLNTEYIGLISNKASFVYKQTHERYQDILGLIGLGKQDNSYKTKEISYKHYFEYFLFTNTILKANIYAKKEYYDLTNNLSLFSYNTSSRTAFIPAFEVYTKLWRLTINPSIMYEKYQDTLYTDLGENKKNYQDISPKLGLKLNIFDFMEKKQNFIQKRHEYKSNFQYKLDLFTNIGRYFRIPTFYELFGDRGFIVGNPSIEAEQSINFDIGFNFILKKMFHKLSFSSFYFVNNVDKSISYVYDARGVGKAVNIEKAQIQGIETALNYFYKSFRLDLNYTYKSPIVGSGLYEGNVLAGRFTNKLFLKIIYNMMALFKFSTNEQVVFKNNMKLFTWYSFAYSSGLYYDSVNNLSAIPKYLHNIGIRYEQNFSKKQTTVFIDFSIKNLLGKNYQDYHRFYTAGREYKLSLGIEF